MKWTNIINQLIDYGMTEQSIANTIGGTTQPTIHRIKTGDIKEPKHSLGERLIAIHKEKIAA